MHARRSLTDPPFALQTHDDRRSAPELAPLFHPLKHNRVVSALARRVLRALAFRLERLIFTATTGRSGTMTLTRLFSAVPGCISRHEPWPPMSGPVLRAASYGEPCVVRDVFYRVKLINILRASVGHRYYFEANHCFVKSFAQCVAEEFGDRIAVIHLVRPATDVAMSIYRLREEPGTRIGNAWWLDYRAPSNLIQIADLLDSDPEFSHPFYKALWYWHEIEARIVVARTAMPLATFVRFETAWLADRSRILQLFADLGLPCDASRLAPLLGAQCNRREDQKSIPGLPPERAELMLARFREMLARRGLRASPAIAIRDETEAESRGANDRVA